jgi:peroxiredoxin
VARKHRLTFSVLSDPKNEVAERFGMVISLPDDLRAVYSQFGIVLPRYNGDDTWTLPMPGRFILDRSGTILHREVHPDYTQRPEPADIPVLLASNRQN